MLTVAVTPSTVLLKLPSEAVMAFAVAPVTHGGVST